MADDRITDIHDDDLADEALDRAISSYIKITGCFWCRNDEQARYAKS